MVSAIRDAASLSARFNIQSLRYVLGIFFIINVFNYADRYAVAALAPLIQAELRISDSQLGMLTGLAFSLFYAICGIPMARVVDSHSRRNILSYALTCWSAMTALCGLARGFWSMLLARIGVGVGEAACNPAVSTMICDFFPLERRPAAFAIYGLGAFVGMALGLGFAGWIGSQIGWRWTFFILGAPGVALAILIRATLREPRRGHFDPIEIEVSRTQKSLWVIANLVFRSRSYLLLVSFASLNGFAMSGLGQWWPSFFHRVHGLDPADAGLYLGLIIGIGSAIGVLGGGLLANRLVLRTKLSLIWIPLVSITIAAPAAILSLLTPSSGLSLLLVLIVNLCWSVPNGAMTTAVYAVCPIRDRATAGAFLFFLTAVFGLGLGPFAVGFVSDLFTVSSGTDSLRLALFLPAGALVLMILSLILLTRTFLDDVKGAASSSDSSGNR